MAVRRRTWLVVMLAVAACSQRIADGGDPTDDVLEPDAPAVLARAECAPQFECECSSTQHGDQDECVETRTAEYVEMAEAARMEGLAYDGECVASIVAWYADIGCGLQSSFTFPEPERPRCHPYALPDVASMSACTLPAAFGGTFATPCPSGELCIDGLCSPPWWLVGAEIGERCPAPEGCVYPGTCVADECVARIPPGGACGEDILAACDHSTYCDGSTCAAKLEPGAPCEGEGFDASCVNQACADGVCADVPALCVVGP